MNDGLFNGFGPAVGARKGDLMTGGAHLDAVRLAAGANHTVPVSASQFAGGYRTHVLQPPAYRTDTSDVMIDMPGVMSTATLNQKPAAATIHYMPFWVPSPIRVSEASINVQTAGTAGSKLRGSLYYGNSDLQPTNLVKALDEYWQPTGKPLGDLGEWDGGSTGRKDITGLSIDLDRGLYFAGIHADNSATIAILAAFRGRCLALGAMIGKTNWQFVYQFTKATAYAVAADPAVKWDTLATSSGLFIYYMNLRWTVL